MTAALRIILSPKRISPSLCKSGMATGFVVVRQWFGKRQANPSEANEAGWPQASVLCSLSGNIFWTRGRASGMVLSLPFQAKNAWSGLCRIPGGAVFDMVAAGENLIGVKLLFDAMELII